MRLIRSCFLIIFMAFTQAAHATPALWRVADSDTEIHLFGTLHILSDGMEWLSPEARVAFMDSGALIVELSGEEIDRAGPLFTVAGKLPEGQSLRKLVGNGIYNDVERLSRKLGLPANHFAENTPWFTGLSLTVIGLVKAGYNPASGADKFFIAQAEGMRKPVFGLETAAQQVALFQSLTVQQEKALLVDTLQQNAQLDVYYASMQGAWLSGNVAELDHILNDALAIAPELREKMLSARNRDWADKLMQVLDRPGKFFVAVGAGHLTGDDSVIKLLEGMGVPAARIE